MRFEEQNNETKITTMLDKIYKKLAGDEAEVDTNLDAYPNDVKVPLLLEKIYEVVDNSGGSGGEGGVTVDSVLSTTSTNPVQNKVITTTLNSKAGTSVATTSANGLMSSTDKGRLDDLYADYSSALTALGVI